MQGSLSTLQCALDPAQYRVLRGVLAHNLAEDVADLQPPHQPHQPQHQHDVSHRITIKQNNTHFWTSFVIMVTYNDGWLDELTRVFINLLFIIYKYSVK